MTTQKSTDDRIALLQGTRYLIALKYTSPAHLGIEGTSAGGIAVGGFLTQHPELVGAVLYRVGITDILRSEQRSTGAMNAFEYGSVKVEPEFRAMYAISPYAHVQEGAKYPPVMLATGANNPREQLDVDQDDGTAAGPRTAAPTRSCCGSTSTPDTVSGQAVSRPSSYRRTNTHSWAGAWG
jgi:hypothetical protein